MYQSQKGGSHPQPALPVDTEAAHLNIKSAPTDIDTYTAVSNWLATSQTFEQPPTTASNTDPAPPQRRLPKEHWLGISKNLDLRIKSRAEHLKGPNHSCPRLVYGTHRVEFRVWETSLQSKLAEPDKDISQSQEELEKKQERELEQQLGAARSINEAGDEAVKATAKRSESPKSEKAKETETQLEAETLKKVKAKAKILAAAAMTAQKNQQNQQQQNQQEQQEKWERKKKHIESRAREIHERMLLCKPFDVDALRREFEGKEEDVRGVKRRVWELGFLGEGGEWMGG